MSSNTAVNSPQTEWQDPLDYARSLECGNHWALLYSGMTSQGSGRYSYLATHPTHTVEGNHLSELESALSNHPGRWFGYLGYGLRHDIESVTKDVPGPITLPELSMFNPSQTTIWDHEEQRISGNHTPSRISSNAYTPPVIASLASNMSKAEYIAIVERTLKQIHVGTFYQANITRKFYGEFEQTPEPFTLFQTLCKISPAPFSAYIQLGDTAILSSSPEGFLSIDEHGRIITRPIKGSAPRGLNESEDAKILQSLLTSRKDKAENLMIVDLMRNDLSRCCTAGSVSVSALFDVHSYTTIHQMVSTITGQRREECCSLDVIRACFPPGSMTGAPKIRAMDWCAQQEKLARGVYSGAIGWIDGEGSCDLSVVIRTLIMQGNHFEFQVGGGIVADSDPEKEWEETLVKARAIAQTLGIDEAQLRSL